jgi:predicted Zn-dependent protease
MKNKKSKLKSIPKRRPLKKRGSVEIASSLSRRQSEDLYDAVEMLENEEYDEAEGILLQLNSKGVFVEVIELLTSLYLESRQFRKALDQASRLRQLCPNDPTVRFRYATTSMFNGFAGIAMAEFIELLHRWPDDDSVSEVDKLMRVLTEEVEKRIRFAKFPEGAEGLRLQVLHEESLDALQRHRFDSTIAKCKELISVVPEFCSARNNLALACFHAGRHADAIEAAEATSKLMPENRFAAILLAKLRLVSGELEPPKALIEQLLKDPPDNQDAVVLGAEWLAMLGCDEELVKYLQAVPPSVLVDSAAQASCLHYEAYGRSRIGQSKEAKLLWQKSIKLDSQGTLAEENLNELCHPQENAHWPCSMQQWVPSSSLERLNKSVLASPKPGSSVVPCYLIKLLPVFLDRGCPVLRKLAVAIGMMHGSSESMELLKQFAQSKNGPESLRYQILMSLNEKGVIDKGPHPFFTRGRFTEVKLQKVEIYHEATSRALSPKLQLKLEDAVEATHNGDFDRAEQLYQEILLEEPDNNSVQSNLVVVWLRRDGKAGEQKAQAVWEAIHRRDPDYMFAGVGLAQLHIFRGDYDAAQKLLNLYSDRERLHVTEAKSLYIAQAQLAKSMGDSEKAIQIVDMLEGLVPDDPEVKACRRFVEREPILSKIRDLFNWR